METPPPRYRRDTDTEEAPAPTASATCLQCTHADPDHRSRHYLSLARYEGVDGLRAHLYTQFVSLRDHGKQRPDSVDDICTWVGDLMKLYENLAHPDTGAPLTWQQARAWCAGQLDAMAEAAFRRAPAGYTWTKKPLESWLQAVMARHAPTATREPGEDALEDI